MTTTSVIHEEAQARKSLDREGYERFLPIVRRIAMRLVRRLPRHIAVNDLVSCGWVGVMEAVSRAPGTMPAEEFEAYAVYRIRGAMLDYLRSMDPASRRTRRSSRDLARTIQALRRELRREPTEEEIAGGMGLSAEEYADLLSRISEAGMARLELMDFDKLDAAGSVPSDADEYVERQQMSAAVAKAIETLPERSRQMLALYYQHQCTLREIGEVLGVTESRVCQLHTEAMHRLRAALEKE